MLKQWILMALDIGTKLRAVPYLNNIDEQDYRAIKRVTRPMLNFKSFRSAGSVLAGVELIHMIRKGQFAIDGAGAIHSPTNFRVGRNDLSSLRGAVPFRGNSAV